MSLKAYARIAECIDVERMHRSHVALIGAGGSHGLACNLVRSGLGAIDLYDFDVVSEENLSRQAHNRDAVGRLKVDALADDLRRINPDVHVRGFARDVTQMTSDETTAAFTDIDLIVNATDSFLAHAWGNRTALQFGIPALWIGLYPKGAAGEIIFWHEEILACYRCLCPKRYRAHELALAAGRSLDPSSHGCTIFEIAQLDAVAGEIAVGLLTRGANNRFGRLIAELGNRNFIQMQFHANWSLNGGNPVRRQLGVGQGNSAYFAWNSIALADPDDGLLHCPDCEQYRGHIFTTPLLGTSERIIPVANRTSVPTDNSLEREHAG